jgi:hypothetical protein
MRLYRVHKQNGNLRSGPTCTEDCFGESESYKENIDDDFDSQPASRRGKGRMAKRAKPKEAAELKSEDKPAKEKPVKKPPAISKKKGSNRKATVSIEAALLSKFAEFDSIEKTELAVC